MAHTAHNNDRSRMRRGRWATNSQTIPDFNVWLITHSTATPQYHSNLMCCSQASIIIFRGFATRWITQWPNHQENLIESLDILCVHAYVTPKPNRRLSFDYYRQNDDDITCFSNIRLSFFFFKIKIKNRRRRTRNINGIASVNEMQQPTGKKNKK